MAADVKSVVE
jgi:hypothetical protein